MKFITIKCDYCKKEIEDDHNGAIIDGKGELTITLPDGNFRIQLDLKETTGKNVERDACYPCLTSEIWGK